MGGDVTPPMPAVVQEILVEVGAEVDKGARLAPELVAAIRRALLAMTGFGSTMSEAVAAPRLTMVKGPVDTV